MPDQRFFTPGGLLALSDIASLTGATLASGDASRLFASVAPLETAGENDLSFFDNIKYAEAFEQSKAGACFVRPQYKDRAPKHMALLLTDEPYAAYAIAAQRLFPEPAFEPGISPQAVIAQSATIGKGARLESGVIIGENVTIGEKVRIGAHTVIGDHVEIGDGSRIAPLCTISHAIIGKRAIIHPGAHIGQDGFGFAPGPKGILKVPQLGRVLIGDDVEIGANSCIDRGAGPDTVIGDGSKIDNLVQIGHNVQLGKCVIITGQCGIAGSTRLGDGVMLGAQAGLAGHLHIGAGAKLAARAGLMRDVPAGETYCGTPAIPIKEFFKQVAVLAKLAKKGK